MEAKKYSEGLANIATALAMKYFAVVNFVCLPADEFAEKKSWYAYFRNIDLEGEVLYGARVLSGTGQSADGTGKRAASAEYMVNKIDRYIRSNFL